MDDEIEPTTQVIVKVNDAVEISALGNDISFSVDDLVSQSGEQDGDAVEAVRSAGASATFTPAIVSLSSSDLSGLVDRATTEDPEYSAPKFDHFLSVACEEGVDAQTLADALNGWSTVVEYAYVLENASDANVVGTGNPLFDASRQDYLNATPDGINAKAAWSRGADGAEISFIDIEQGWFLAHEDLPQTINLLQGTNRKSSFAHGAGVLGEIVGVDNQTGIVGIAPGATAQVLSYNDDLTSGISLQRVADRILSAANALPFGSVMLLEVQITGTVGGNQTVLPVETDPLAFHAIELATKAGVIVVEAAGNGQADLDAFVMDKGPRKGQHTLSRTNATEFADSGAILVAASTSTPPHNRASFSNFGSRVDCFAWGENIVTTGWDKDKPTETNRYWGVNLTDGAGNPSFFGGTSGASPIIVGCCLLLQSLRTILTPKSGSGKLGPFSMRRCLSNPSNGTASAQAADRIGVMPDFAKIIANEFQP
jgi:Subtilase family